MNSGKYWCCSKSQAAEHETDEDDDEMVQVHQFFRFVPKDDGASANQPLHLTAAALGFFRVQRLASRCGR
jgi:hypothetical protein